MKYCPLCAAEYREGIERCATCGAALVPSLSADEVRANPPRLLWIGGTVAEFDAVAAALREANIPALVEEAPSKILQKFFKAESQICVLQSDFQRGLETAAKAISAFADDLRETQKCYQCGAETSAALTVCPKCAATLILERKSRRETSSAEETRIPRAWKYCPLCNTKYPESFRNCTVCGVDLVPEEMRGRLLRADELKEKIVIAWRGGDPVAVSNVVRTLRETGIRYHVESTHDYFVFGLAMPRPKYTVRVFQSDAEKARELLSGIADSPFFGTEISSDFPDEPVSPVHQADTRWNPAAATVEIWTGDDAAFGRLLEDCFRENEIGFRGEGREPGALRLFVTKQDEARAKEIIREVREGTPPV
jgi:hypothetical protein